MLNGGERLLGVDLRGAVGKGDLHVAAIQVGGDEHLDADLLTHGIHQTVAALEVHRACPVAGNLLLGRDDGRVIHLGYAAHGTSLHRKIVRITLYIQRTRQH